ncbi:MAG TPA: glycosyltransferase family 4 protein [Candidatus Dormibacteraeota bacterium]|nr:glycosyltransferase family 4 protein [Candidatus Dormibacteraeota bacterium]
MKILIISNLFPPGFIGGYELGALDVAMGLSRLGHRVTVLTSSYFVDHEQTLSELDVRRTLMCTAFVHYSPNHHVNRLDGPFYNFTNVRLVGSVLREIRPDLVMTFNLDGLGVLGLLQYLRSLRVPTVIYIMDNIFTGVEPNSKVAENYLSIVGGLDFDETTAIIAMSRVVEREVEEAIRTSLSNVEYVPGWIDLRESQGLPLTPRDGRTRFVYYSGIVPHKGIELVLDAAHVLVREGHVDFTVDVIGGGDTSMLLEAIDKLGLREIVTYRGVIAKRDAVRTLSAYDALLFPTWHREPFGFVAVEAAAAGCVPIITAGIGSSEWLVDGVDSLFVERNAKALSVKMLEVMGMSDQELLDLRTSAKETANKSFGFDRWLQEIERIALSLMSGSLPVRTWAQSHKSESALLTLATLWRESLDSPWSLRRVLYAYRRNRGLRAVRWVEDVVLPLGSKRRAHVKGIFLRLP